MQPGVSVIICSYNGAKRLPQTLQHLVNQKVPPDINWEVIVVDNNSTDNTYEMVKTAWESYNTDIIFTLAKQPRPGVSYAREMGIEISRYAYIIQCDDDNWLEEGYVKKVFEILSNNINIGIVGGQSVGSFEIEPPAWFNNFATAYAVGQRRQESCRIDWLATAGVGIRRKALDELKAINFQHILSGRKGKNLLAGDDLELCAALRAIGYEVFYSIDLNFVHYMTANRLTWQYLKKMVHGQGRAQAVFDMYTIVYKMRNENKDVSFEIAYKTLWQQVMAPVRKRCKTVRKTFRFIKSLLSDKEGDGYRFLNRYFFNYAVYVTLHKREIKENYYKIVKFYDSIKTGVPI